MTYKLIAFDLDGTLLDSNMRISQTNISAIKSAVQEDKTVIFCTGRSIPGLQTYLDELPEIRYIVGASGGFVKDLNENHNLYQRTIPHEMVSIILESTKPYDVMIVVMTDEFLVEKHCFEHMENYQMARAKSGFSKAGTFVENIRKYYYSHPDPVYKVNLFFKTAEDKASYRPFIEQYDLEVKDAETACLEITLKNITKSMGVSKLCEHLGITMEEVIAVGDSDNDLEVLQAVGLGIAVANANDKVKRLCSTTVSSNDEDGCAEAIYKYLLQKEVL